MDACLAGLLIVRLPAPGLPVPLAQVALMALLVVVAFRRPTRTVPAWFPVMCAVLVLWLLTVSVVGEVDFVRRLGNIVLLLTMAGFLASGRIHVTSAIKGLAGALVVNIGLFYAGIAPDNYGGALTGLIADKNVAGMFHAIVPLLLVLAVPRERLLTRFAILAAGGAALVLTDSRTSMAAYAAGVLWLLVAPHLRSGLRAVLAVAIATGFLWADSNLASIGSYSESRAGSDALRARIDEAAGAKAALAPWYGEGLGTAVADLDGQTWFFHNSYDALRVEGGYVLMVLVVGLYLLTGLGMFLRTDRHDPRHGVAAATVVVLLCATRLGEVFFAPIGLFVIGVGAALAAERLAPPGGIADILPEGTSEPGEALPTATTAARAR